MEQSIGLGGNNIVTVIMQDRGVSLQEAVDFVGVHFKALLDGFIEDVSTLRSFGAEVDVGVQRYITSIKDAVIGNMIWCFETTRYFGSQGLEIKDTLIVQFREPKVPKANSSAA